MEKVVEVIAGCILWAFIGFFVSMLGLTGLALYHEIQTTPEQKQQEKLSRISVVEYDGGKYLYDKHEGIICPVAK